jgi:hypothetical protein
MTDTKNFSGNSGGVPGASTEHNLEFFNSLFAVLDIELSKPAKPIGNLVNLTAKPEAKIVSLRLVAQVYEEEDDNTRDLTEAELNTVVFFAPMILIRGASGDDVGHQAPNGKHFNVRELLAAIEETERQTRGKTEWFEGIDIHHIFFDGIGENEQGVWEIFWGS